MQSYYLAYVCSHNPALKGQSVLTLHRPSVIVVTSSSN